MKPITSGMFSCLGDTKKTVVVAANKCLNQWADAVGMDAFLPYLPSVMQVRLCVTDR